MRKILVLLTLAVVTAGSIGCAGRCRNLFRRGSPCCGTARVAPAMIAAPVAITAPVRAPAPVVQPMVMPQMIQQPACCPQAAPACQPCNPCPSECSPCESASQGEYFGGAQGEYFGGYIEGSSIGGDCQDCGSIPTFNQGEIVDQGAVPPGSEIHQVVPEGSGTRQDPGPTTQN